jgi:glutamate mutase epsilon subunit
MIIGQTIAAVDSAGTGSATKVYTPWISTFGNSGIFSFEIISLGGGAAVQSFTAQVYTKNTEDPDPGTAKGTLSSQTNPGTYSILDATDLLELVRLEFKLNVKTSAGVNTGVCHFRPLNPSWKTN